MREIAVVISVTDQMLASAKGREFKWGKVARQMIERWEGVVAQGDGSFRRLSH